MVEAMLDGVRARRGHRRNGDLSTHHMRISVPSLPNVLLDASTSTPRTSHSEAVERIAEFIKPGNVAVLTGAGVSVDSGIRAYRGRDGRYMNPNYK